MHASAARTQPDADMVSAMVDCAYALGMAAGQIAEGCKHDPERFLEASAEFRQCFFAVRMGMRLRLNLLAAPRLAAERREAPEREAPEREDSREAPERERGEGERERDREGDYEPVSLPQFLKSLRGVAGAAERRKDELPRALATHTLPKLHGLLAESAERPASGATGHAPAAAGVALLTRRPGAAPPRPRSSLLGSAAAPLRGPPWRSSG